MPVRKKKTGQVTERVNKSKTIRDFKATHKKLKPKQIAEALSQQGLDVDAQYVSMVLSLAKKKNKAKRTTGVAANGIDHALSLPKNAFGIEELRLAKQFVDKLGVSRAQAVLAAYKQLAH
ncbi:MAG TPA: hypothetical protein PKD54_10645 [Pirellulaceae bacterium]|nr:hypothetical protein [Pirellulaceae bacterium]